MSETRHSEPHLFTPWRARSVQVRNRIGLSPMCQYSADAGDGRATAWHTLHYGARAAGGAGLVLVEATAVEARGRITPYDLGCWGDAHLDGLRTIADAISAHGATAGIQLAHAGRKAGTARPWQGGKPLAPGDAWEPVGPSATAFSPAHRVPHALTMGELGGVIEAFARAAERCAAAGFALIEIHAAHGYLLHSFHSPLANLREDDYGGPFEHRVRLTCQIARAVRAAIGPERAAAVRLSASDWTDGGWTLDESVRLARLLRDEGIDLIDCSSGGIAPGIAIPDAPGYQVPFAEAVRDGAAIATAAVGCITTGEQAEAIIAEGRADLALIGRAMLADPAWAQNAARSLRSRAGDLLPAQYRWALER
jgi:2,4-dienoyl-CoA reductase-like NADH-dependent reductase (Old Yellow Enzyme family)